MRFLLWFPCAAVLVAAGCRATPPGDPDLTRVDSAGVRLLTSRHAETSLAWRVEEIGLLSAADGTPWRFDRVAPDLVQADRAGRTYVLVGDSMIVRFGRDGRSDRVLGARGTGAGAFVRPTSIGTQGDSLVVLDVGKGALVRFGPSLDSLPDRPLAGALLGASWLRFRVGGVWRWQEGILVGDTVSGASLVPGVATLPPHAVGPRLLVAEATGYVVRLFEGPRLLAVLRRDAGTPLGRLDAVALQSDAHMYVRRVPAGDTTAVVDVFGTDGAYRGTWASGALPVALLPNGEMLRPRPADDGVGVVIARLRVVR